MKELIKALKKETKERTERSQKLFEELKTLEEKENYISRFYYNKSLSRFYKKENAQTNKQKEKALLKIIKLEKLANQQKGLETIETLKALKGEKVRKVRICVEWHASRTWGANPTSTVEVFSVKNYEFKTGYASGCGYDKESASIANAMNQCDHLKALLYRAKEKALKRGEALPYGLGNYSALPHFEGGVGVSCFLHFFESLGAKVESVHGKSSSFYYIDFEQGKGAK